MTGPARGALGLASLQRIAGLVRDRAIARHGAAVRDLRSAQDALAVLEAAARESRMTASAAEDAATMVVAERHARLAEQKAAAAQAHLAVLAAEAEALRQRAAGALGRTILLARMRDNGGRG